MRNRKQSVPPKQLLLTDIKRHTIMSNIKFFAVALLALGQSAYAAEPPSSGGQFQQIPPSPLPQRALPDIRVEQDGNPSVQANDTDKIMVNSLQVSGQTLYSETELIAISGFIPGRELTLRELRTMAARIAAHYRNNGYFVAQVYLPAQDIKDGAVKMSVIEGRYDKITVRNQANISDGVPSGLLGGLNSGDTIAIVPLENRLLLLSDIPGVNVRSTLVPGASVGTSDLIVDVTPGKRVTGSVEADNAGSRYTGEERVGATVNINNPFGIGDVIGLRMMTSGSGLTYGRASYQVPVGKATLGVAYAALKYRLGEEFASLQAHGTAEIASIYGSYPLIRSRNTNLYAMAGFDYKTFEDRVDVIPTVTNKEAQVGWLALHGNHLDNFGGGGASSFSLTQSFGDLNLETPAARTVDAATSRTAGSYHKLAYHLARLQRVTDRISAYGAVNGQFASKNLDISEKMGMGGPYAVRAYPVGETYADEGYIVNLEARLRLPKPWEQLPGQIHLVGFYDTGTVTINKNPWAAGQNRRTLRAAGLGLTWAEYNNFQVSAYWAQKVGNEVATSAPDEKDRYWVRLVKYF